MDIFTLIMTTSTPIAPLLFSKVGQGGMVLLTLKLFALDGVVSVLASGFAVLLVTQVLPTFLRPMCMSVTFAMTTTSIDGRRTPGTISGIFVNISTNVILNIPIADFVTDRISFSVTVLFFAIIGTLMFITAVLFVPSVPMGRGMSCNTRLDMLGGARV